MCAFKTFRQKSSNSHTSSVLWYVFSDLSWGYIDYTELKDLPKYRYTFTKLFIPINNLETPACGEETQLLSQDGDQTFDLLSRCTCFIIINSNNPSAAMASVCTRLLFTGNTLLLKTIHLTSGILADWPWELEKEREGGGSYWNWRCLQHFKIRTTTLTSQGSQIPSFKQWSPRGKYCREKIYIFIIYCHICILRYSVFRPHPSPPLKASYVAPLVVHPFSSCFLFSVTPFSFLVTTLISSCKHN